MSPPLTNPPKNFFKENPGNDKIFEDVRDGLLKIQELGTGTINKDSTYAYLNQDAFLENIEKIGKIFDLIKKKNGNELSAQEDQDLTIFSQNKAFLNIKKEKYSKDNFNPDDSELERDAVQINEKIVFIGAFSENLKGFMNDYIAYKNEKEKNEVIDKVKKILINSFNPEITKNTENLLKSFTDESGNFLKQGIKFQTIIDQKTNKQSSNFVFSEEIENNKDNGNSIIPSSRIVLEAFDAIATETTSLIKNLETKTYENSRTGEEKAKDGIQYNEINIKGNSIDFGKTEKTIDDLANEEKLLKIYFKDVLFSNEKLKPEFLLQKQLVSDYLGYVKSQNNFFYEKTEIYDPDNVGKKITVFNFLKRQEEEFKKLFDEFEKKQFKGLDEFKSAYDDLNKNIKTNIIFPIEENVLTKKSEIVTSFNDNVLKKFLENDENINEINKIANNLNNIKEPASTMIGRLSDKISNKFEKIKKKASDVTGIGVDYLKEKELNKASVIEENNGKKTSLEIKEENIRYIEEINPKTRQPKKTLAFVFDTNKDSTTSLNLNAFFESTSKSTSYASDSKCIIFNNKNEFPSMAKISIGQKDEQIINISGPGMFVSLFEQNKKMLKELNLEKIYVMEKPGGLGFFDQDGNEIRNKDVIDKIKDTLEKEQIIVNGKDVHTLAEEISVELSSTKPVGKNPINVGFTNRLSKTSPGGVGVP